MGIYRTAQICLNGHSTTSSIDEYPELGEKYCSKCGVETISECPTCQNNIRGYYHVEGVYGGSEYSPPNFCHACGNLFPWTASKVDSAKELADELEELNAEERETLKVTISDLLTDSPKTEVAAVRYKKLAKKLGTGASSALRSILVDVASEAAKKALFGDN